MFKISNYNKKSLIKVVQFYRQLNTFSWRFVIPLKEIKRILKFTISHMLRVFIHQLKIKVSRRKNTINIYIFKCMIVTDLFYW